MTGALRGALNRARRRPPAVTPPIDFDPDAPRVVLSPHVDDAALSCWSAIAPSERSLLIVDVCTALPEAGTLGRWDRMTGARDSRERMAERLEENRDALAAIGREAIGLGFLDAQYRPPDEPLDAPAVLQELADRCPVLGPVLAPVGLGLHPDHVPVRDVAVELARRGFAVTLYADMPYAIEFGWPRWVLNGDPVGARANVDAGPYWQGYLEAVMWPVERMAARVVPLPPPEADAKLASLRRYRTQFDALDSAPLGRLSDPLWRSREVFWDLRT
jgi:LmbE family N-acetylglucosaminyl deacetylase